MHKEWNAVAGLDILCNFECVLRKEIDNEYVWGTRTLPLFSGLWVECFPVQVNC